MYKKQMYIVTIFYILKVKKRSNMSKHIHTKQQVYGNYMTILNVNNYMTIFNIIQHICMDMNIVQDVYINKNYNIPVTAIILHGLKKE
jgi:hypothetical protein